MPSLPLSLPPIQTAIAKRISTGGRPVSSHHHRRRAVFILMQSKQFSRTEVRTSQLGSCFSHNLKCFPGNIEPKRLRGGVKHIHETPDGGLLYKNKVSSLSHKLSATDATTDEGHFFRCPSTGIWTTRKVNFFFQRVLFGHLCFLGDPSRA